jgi:hypothetical protein
LVNHDEASLSKVSEDYPDHPDWQPEGGPKICHRHRGAAQAQHQQVFWLQGAGIEGDRASRRHHCDQVEARARGPGAAANEGIGSDDEPCRIVEPPLA